MAVTYVRRFRMEFDLASCRIPVPTLPPRYVWIPWSAACLERHALVKLECFRGELDSQVFPCLSELAGCQRLMHEIAGQKAFVPGATWLIAYRPSDREAWCDCGTIQGMTVSSKIGSIQNVGIHPAHRGLGLGRCLVLKALAGFRAVPLSRVYLEVTAQNSRAVALYRSIGFRLVRTMYKPLRQAAATSLSACGER